MEKNDVIKNIAKRTGGDIYLGVVGAVRTGKSTFIRRFMENLVIPNIKAYSGKRIVYGFEELENNLHPALQRRLFE